MGLLKKERILISQWPKKGAAMKAPLGALYIGAFATSTETGFVAVEYYFSNKPECDREIQNAEASVF